MKLYRRFVRWLARREIQQARDESTVNVRGGTLTVPSGTPIHTINMYEGTLRILESPRACGEQVKATT